ncbi:MAG: cell division protein SepF [Ruminococcaceae bacterium]|nr:cell division protein SepF [Oscillospiraceae bacterium]
MGFKDLLKRYSREDEGYDQDGYEDYDMSYENETDDNGMAENDEYTAEPAAPVNISGNAIELKVVRPESFKNADQIAEHLLNRRTVVLNLEAAGKDTAKRLIDFLSGVAFAIKGDIRKVSNNTYVITPGNVTVTGDPMTDAARAAAEEESSDEDSVKF